MAGNRCNVKKLNNNMINGNGGFRNVIERNAVHETSVWKDILAKTL